MAFRMFRDPEGREWQVWDVVPSREEAFAPGWPGYLPPEMAEGWLCFEAADQKRRLSPYPRGWEERDEAGIQALCQNALPVTRRRTLTSGG